MDESDMDWSLSDAMKDDVVDLIGEVMKMGELDTDVIEVTCNEEDGDINDVTVWDDVSKFISEQVRFI